MTIISTGLLFHDNNGSWALGSFCGQLPLQRIPHYIKGNSVKVELCLLQKVHPDDLAIRRPRYTMHIDLA